MSYGSLYSGTVSRQITLTNGSPTVACSGTVLTEEDLRALDTLAVGTGHVVKLASITDDDTFELLRPWAGTTQTLISTWDIIRDAPSRLDQVEAASAMTQAAGFAALVNGQTRQFRVESEDNGPPGSPVDGKYYLAGSAPSGWPITVTAGDIVKRRLGSYGVITPEEGWLAVILATGAVKRFKSGAWGVAAVTATDVAFTPTGGVAATTVQEAIAEVDSEKVTKASGTTAGRLWRFTDTAGGLGQSQTSEDGSGNLTVVGTIQGGTGAYHQLVGTAADATHRMHVSGGATGWSAGLNRPGDSAGTSLIWSSYASATWTARAALTNLGYLGLGGATAPTSPLQVGTSAGRVSPGGGYLAQTFGGGNSYWLLNAAANFNSAIHFGDPDSNTVGKIEYIHNGDRMEFHTAGAERMRLLSGGDLLLGRTSASGYSARLDIQCPAGGYGYVITDATYATNVIRFSLSYGVEMGNIGGSPLHFLTTNIQRITILADGKVGISTVNPAAVFDVNGDVAHRMAALTLVNGANQNVSRPAFSSLRVTGPTGAFNIGGLTGGGDGIEVELINTTAHQMTLNTEDASSTAGNRITTDTGGNLNCKHAVLRYDATASRWRVISYRT